MRIGDVMPNMLALFHSQMRPPILAFIWSETSIIKGTLKLAILEVVLLSEAENELILLQ